MNLALGLSLCGSGRGVGSGEDFVDGGSASVTQTDALDGGSASATPGDEINGGSA